MHTIYVCIPTCMGHHIALCRSREDDEHQQAGEVEGRGRGRYGGRGEGRRGRRRGAEVEGR